MSEPFLGQIQPFGFNFAPRGWATCDGQLLSIAQNTALFSLLGTTYGGNGQVTFGLPDLRGRRMIHQGQGPGLQSYQMGQVAGTEATTLLSTQMPQHTHVATFSGTGSTLTGANAIATKAGPGTNLLARATVDGTNPINIYAPAGTTPTGNVGGLNVAGTVTNAVAGGSQPFSLLSPYLTINICIALEGIFPSRN